MSLLGKALEKVTGGVLHEVDDEQKPPSHMPETATHPAADHRPIQAKPASNDAAISAQASKNLAKVLDAVPEKFRVYLLKREEYADLLREGGGTDERKIDSVATAKAIKSIKLTIGDVHDAVAAAKQSLEALKANFAGAVQQKERATVAQPTEEIAKTTDLIQRLQAQVQELQKQMSDLQAGIAPKRQAITDAQANIESATYVFTTSCASVEASIASMQAGILEAMQAKS